MFGWNPGSMFRRGSSARRNRLTLRRRRSRQARTGSLCNRTLTQHASAVIVIVKRFGR